MPPFRFLRFAGRRFPEERPEEAFLAVGRWPEREPEEERAPERPESCPESVGT